MFYATDLHGSEVCWRKFLNAAKFFNADILICGGDMTGKAMIPIVEDGDSFELTLSGVSQRVGRDEVAEVETQVQRKGYYPVRMTSAQVAELEKDPAKVQTLFTEQMCKTVERWMQMAEEKLKDSKVRVFVAPGNDDEIEIDEVIANATRVELAEGKMIDIGGYEMISSGWANPTPWHTYREAPEEELTKRMEPMIRDIKDMSRAIFNFHPPPFGTQIDEAPALDEELRPKHGGRAMEHVGSKAVREAIDQYQPMLSLHGHIHEGKGITRIGKTLAINPGSAYEEGLLLAAILELDQKKGIKNYQLVNG
ncbi:MAG: metallophosphoesterase [Candidatus Dormibacteraeota bacterium]|nr:metallophosphoesterase [Candidatus Dormibacteraeota bacterium]